MEIHTIKFGIFSVILFIKPKTNVNSIRSLIVDWIKEFIEENKQKLLKVIQTGHIKGFIDEKIKAENWLKDLNETYEKMTVNWEIYDKTQAENLYSYLDEFLTKIDFEHALTIEKIKKMKMSLMESIVQENFFEIREIAEKIRDLSF